MRLHYRQTLVHLHRKYTIQILQTGNQQVSCIQGILTVVRLRLLDSIMKMLAEVQTLFVIGMVVRLEIVTVAHNDKDRSNISRLGKVWSVKVGLEAKG